MFQNLLIERFKLVLRHETKQLPVYELVVGKSGHKLRPSRDVLQNEIGGTPKDAPPNFPQNMAGGEFGGLSNGLGFQAGYPIRYLSYRHQDGLRSLAVTIQVQTHRTVVDRTGLKGSFDFDLYYSPLERPDSPGLSIFDALQQQLGLRLDDTKSPLETIVVESGDRMPI